MSSVSYVARSADQPYGGYIKPSQFEEIPFTDDAVLSTENVHPSITGMAVDYLTRFMTGSPVEKAFVPSYKGYLCYKKFIKNDESDTDLPPLFSHIKGLDNNSISCACKVCTFDVWYRNPADAVHSKGPDETNPDDITINNIRIMVNRSITFWEKYGPIIADGFTFDGGGYTETVNVGDGDFLTNDTLWDFKVSKLRPNNKHTLQLLMYWIMGQHSNKKEFKNINKLGIYNPRLNKAYLLDVKNIPEDIIKAVERNVICY